MEFDPKGFFSFRSDGESRKNEFSTQLEGLRHPGVFALLARAQQKCWYETDLVEFDPKGVFFFRPDGKTRQNEFSTQLEELRHPGVFRCLVKPTQNGGMKPTWWNSIPRVLFRFAPMGNVEKTSFKRNWTTFVNPAFSAAW